MCCGATVNFFKWSPTQRQRSLQVLYLWKIIFPGESKNHKHSLLSTSRSFHWQILLGLKIETKFVLNILVRVQIRKTEVISIFYCLSKCLRVRGEQFWVFIGRTDAEAETPILWPPHVKSWLTGKDSDAGRDWGQEEKGTTEDEMAGWHHWLNRREFEWTPGVGDGQGGLACCGSWRRKESEMTQRLNSTELNWRPAKLMSFFLPY